MNFLEKNDPMNFHQEFELNNKPEEKKPDPNHIDELKEEKPKQEPKQEELKQEELEREQEIEIPDPFLKSVLQWIINIGVFMMPLFFLPWTSSFVEFQKQTLLIGIAGIALIIWLAGTIKNGVIQLRNSKMMLPIAFFLLSIFVASIFSIEKFRSIFGVGNVVSGSLATYVSLIILFLIIIFTVEDGGARIIKFLVLSSVVALILGMLQTFEVFLIPLSFAKSKIFTTLGQLNSMGVLSAVLLPLLIGSQRLKNSGHFWKYLRFLGIGTTIFVLAFINWWILWTIVVASMIIFIVTGYFYSQGFKPKKFVLPMVIIVMGIFFILTNLNLSFLKKGLPLEVAPSFPLSFNVAKETLKESPVFGYGLENFIFAYEKFGTAAFTGTIFSELRFQDAVSEFFTIAVQAGIVGIAAILYLIVSLILIVLKNIRLKKHIDETGLAFISALIIGYFLYPFNMLLMFVFWIGLAVFILNIEKDERKIKISLENSPRYSLASSVVFVLGLVLALVGWYYTIIRYRADIKFAQAATESNIDKALEKIVSAININPYDSRYYNLGANIILSRIESEIQKKDSDPQRQVRIQNFIQGAFDITKRATDINPHDSQNWAQRGFVYQNLLGIVGDADNLAIQSYLEALKRSPSNSAVYNRIGQILLIRADSTIAIAATQKDQAKRSQLVASARNDLINAEASFKKAVEINNNFGLAIYNLGVVYEREGKLKEAIGQIEKIISFNNTNAGLAFELGLLYHRNNQKDLALQRLKKAVEIAPNYANALWYLALIYEERKELDKAISQLNKILDIEENKGNPIVTQKLSELKTGKTSIPPQKVTDLKPL